MTTRSDNSRAVPPPPPGRLGSAAPAAARRIVVWVSVFSASALFLVIGIWWAGPAPPAKIVLATGGETGAYYRHGQEYAKRLGENGLKVQVLTTAGSVENIKLLLTGQADVAFVQGGILTSPDLDVKRELLAYGPGAELAGALASIAALYYEPLWVFYRADKPTVLLNQLRGRRIAVGAKGSGTLALAHELLDRNDVTAKNTDFQYLNGAAAADALCAAKIDAAMIVTSHESEDVRRLIRAPDVQLMSFLRYVAYVKSLPYLGRIDLSQGVLDLRENEPPRDVVLLAPAATLVCRRDLHPTVVYQLLMEAKRLHSSGGLFASAGAFPNATLVDLPLHPAAETFFQSGLPGFASRLPFWAVRTAFKLKILALPLITLLIPFCKLGGGVWRFRIIYLIRRHYDALRRIETEYEATADPAQLQEALDRLQSLREQMADKSRAVPPSYQKEVYGWRLHLGMVVDDFQRRLREARKPTRAAAARRSAPPRRDA